MSIIRFLSIIARGAHGEVVENFDESRGSGPFALEGVDSARHPIAMISGHIRKIGVSVHLVCRLTCSRERALEVQQPL